MATTKQHNTHTLVATKQWHQTHLTFLVGQVGYDPIIAPTYNNTLNHATAGTTTKQVD